MHIDHVLVNLWKDHADYLERRKRAIWRCNTEYVADLDQRIRVTQERIMEANKVKKHTLDHAVPLTYSNAESEVIKHELIEWNEALAKAQEGVHAPRTSTFVASSDRWQFCAEQFVKAHADSLEADRWYNQMLSNVSLGTDYPCLASQLETKQINKRSKRTGTIQSLLSDPLDRRIFGWGLVIVGLFALLAYLLVHLVVGS